MPKLVEISWTRVWISTEFQFIGQFPKNSIETDYAKNHFQWLAIFHNSILKLSLKLFHNDYPSRTPFLISKLALKWSFEKFYCKRVRNWRWNCRYSNKERTMHEFNHMPKSELKIIKIESGLINWCFVFKAKNTPSNVKYASLRLEANERPHQTTSDCGLMKQLMIDLIKYQISVNASWRPRKICKLSGEHSSICQ